MILLEIKIKQLEISEMPFKSGLLFLKEKHMDIYRGKR